MKIFFLFSLLLAAFLKGSDAFIAPVPSVTLSTSTTGRGKVETLTRMSLMGPTEISTLIVAAGEPGSVEAPGWVLPLGAVLVVGTAAAIPFLLKPGEEAAREMQERDIDEWGKK